MADRSINQPWGACAFHIERVCQGILWVSISLSTLCDMPSHWRAQWMSSKLPTYGYRRKRRIFRNKVIQKNALGYCLCWFARRSWLIHLNCNRRSTKRFTIYNCLSRYSSAPSYFSFSPDSHSRCRLARPRRSAQKLKVAGL